MTDAPEGCRTRVARVIKALPEAVYQAFLDPAALTVWPPPGEMTGKIHSLDARVDGTSEFGHRLIVPQ